MNRYCVVTDGPDEIGPPATELVALRTANKINKVFVAECQKNGIDNTPMCVATVIHVSEKECDCKDT